MKSNNISERGQLGKHGLEITNEIPIWQIGMVNGNGYEFRCDVFFSIGKRNFKMDYLGLRHFDFLSQPINYN